MRFLGLAANYEIGDVFRHLFAVGDRRAFLLSL